MKARALEAKAEAKAKVLEAKAEKKAKALEAKAKALEAKVQAKAKKADHRVVEDNSETRFVVYLCTRNPFGEPMVGTLL